MTDVMSLSDYEHLKRTDPQRAFRAMAEGLVKGAPERLIRAHRGVQSGSSGHAAALAFVKKDVDQARIRDAEAAQRSSEES